MAASGRSQNFLGAPWVPIALRMTPTSHRVGMAIWLLSLSPHYIYAKDRDAEAERNRRSRAQLTNDLLLPHLRPGMRVIDYGCGAGYMASAVSRFVETVEAVDLPGVLACARVLNGQPSVIYETPENARRAGNPSISSTPLLSCSILATRC